MKSQVRLACTVLTIVASCRKIDAFSAHQRPALRLAAVGHRSTSCTRPPGIHTTQTGRRSPFSFDATNNEEDPGSPPEEQEDEQDEDDNAPDAIVAASLIQECPATPVVEQKQRILEAPHRFNANTPTRRMRKRKVRIYNKKKTRVVGVLFALWYVLSVWYNVLSKRVLTMAPELAWTSAWFQMALGLIYAGPMWLSGLRTPPTLSRKDTARIMPVALLHALVHVGGVISMGAGAVSFTYIVKATEPAVAALLAALLLNTFLPLPVYMTLIPVIAGVSMASVSELSFSWKAFNYAMMSNVASASRGIVSKKTMRYKLGKNLTAMNLYTVLTIMATTALFPIACALEGSQWKISIARLKDAGQFTSYAVQTVMAALTYYTYNEVSFLCLDNISPISHALASTLRRVFIIVSSMLVFGNKMTTMGISGSSLAVGGALLYSAARHHYKEKALKEKENR